MEAGVAIGLGSNLGDRVDNLRRAVVGLRRHLSRLEVSSVWESVPESGLDQPDYLNACCVGISDLAPEELRVRLAKLEHRAGRISRSAGSVLPRTLDLDLLLYGVRVIESPDLIVPHPRMRDRAFVLLPLAEIAPDWEVPASGGHRTSTVRELLASVDTKDAVRTGFDIGDA